MYIPTRENVMLIEIVNCIEMNNEGKCGGTALYE
jgi:hypothetical protein